MTVQLFILEGAVGHGSPLGDVFLDQHTVPECGCAVDDGNEKEKEDGDAMG